MRIAFLHLFEKRAGIYGADRVVLEMICGMRDRGHDVICLTNAGLLKEALEEELIPVFEIEYSKFRTLKTLAVMRRALKSFKPDVLHSHHRYTSFLAHWFFRRNGVVLLHTHHNFVPGKEMFFRYGDFVACVAKGLEKSLVEDGLVPQDRIATIRNAIRFRAPDPAQLHELRKKFPKSPGQIFGLCAGRLDEQKGPVYLAEAAGLLPPSLRKNLKIFLAGEGPFEGLLREKMQSQGTQDVFTFLGYTQQLPEFFSLCDFLVLPSLWEGLPLVVIEALHSGRAVLATDISGTREVVKSGQNGLLVPPKDPQSLANALEFFLKNPEAVSKMGLRAAKDAEEFSFEHMLESYEHLYQTLCKKG